jgi:hypothetical protein
MAGLLQGLKSETSLAQFKKETKVLLSYQATSCMFLHWDGGIESSKGDYRNHDFVKTRPSLELAIKSLANCFTRQVLHNTALAGKVQPGLLCNRLIINEPAWQPPHCNFVGWRKMKAIDLPWVAHVPLCREGMMLHIWPAERDEGSHDRRVERFKLGQPKLVCCPFGDALLLRADVCHGGCFGSKGNMRFHMVLRKEGCTLPADKLDLLEKSEVDAGVYAEKILELRKFLDKDGTFVSHFLDEMRKKSKTVTACSKALEASCPKGDSWSHKLMGLVHFD